MKGKTWLEVTFFIISIRRSISPSDEHKCLSLYKEVEPLPNTLPGQSKPKLITTQKNHENHRRKNQKRPVSINTRRISPKIPRRIRAPPHL